MAMHADAVIPQDLVMEILSRVPVKSLMRFKCVSKTWNSLIFHPTFVKLHLQRSPKNTHILLICQEGMVCKEESAATCSVSCLLEDPSSTIEEGCYDFDSNYFLLGSCNGLVCLLGSFVGNGFMEYWVRFWNPTTRIMSEDSPHLRLHSCQYKLGNILVKFGFGYDDRSDTYKVVVVVFDIKSHNWEVRVYCLGDTSWRSVLNCPAFPILGHIDGHFVSGTLNWLALRESDFDFQWENVSLNQLVIFSYDLNKETYKYLLMPNGLTELPDASHLSVLKGCLCLSLDLTQGYIITHFVIWQMKEFGDEKSWTQLLKVSYEHLQIDGIPRYAPTIVRPVCLSENDDIVLLANYHCSEFVFYNQKHNKIDRTEGFHGKFPTCSYGYVQSLVLPYRN